MPVLLLSNSAVAQTSDKRIAQIISTKSDHSNSLALGNEGQRLEIPRCNVKDASLRVIINLGSLN
jgi:hypothetical protein